MRVISNSGEIIIDNFNEGAIAEIFIENRIRDVFLNITIRNGNIVANRRVQVKDLETAERLVAQLGEKFDKFDKNTVIDMKY